MKKQNDKNLQAILILRVFYASLIYLLISRFFPKYSQLLLPERKAFFPGYFDFFSSIPLEWIPLISLLPFFLFTLATILWPRHKILRIFVFVFFVSSLAVNYSQGRVDHQYHIVMWILLALGLLPLSNSKSNPEKIVVNDIFALRSSQAFVLLFFFFQGFWKLIMGLQNGSLFWSDFLSQHILDYLIFNNKVAWLGDWLIQHNYLGYFFVLKLILFQLSAAIVIFYPKLYRIWGCYILFFLLSINIFMALPFNFYTFLVALFLVVPDPIRPEITIKEIHRVPRHSRVIMGILVFILMVSALVAKKFERGDYRSALFPFWSFKLFGAAYKIGNNFDIEVLQSGDMIFNPPISLMDFYQKYSSSPYVNPGRTVRIFGHFFKKGDETKKMQEIKETIESLYFSNRSFVRYRLIETEIDLKEYWKTKKIRERNILAEFQKKF